MTRINSTTNTSHYMNKNEKLSSSIKKINKSQSKNKINPSLSKSTLTEKSCKKKKKI
jgi:hypothetical protein